jgi:uncharacterized zinc-type alcohol dehydrogenase-like protein
VTVDQASARTESARSSDSATTTSGYAALTAKAPLKPYSFERRAPRAHDVLIDIQYCGICHSDIHQARAEWGDEAIFPMVPGHEITGTVKAIGGEVTKFKVGDRVGVGCFVDSCRTCAECRQGLEQYCSVRTSWTYNGREKDETPTYGGYSEKIVVDENYVLRIPESLPLDASAPLLCAGITLYSPLKHWKAGPGKKVAIVGLGGLGHMGVKLAHALGADVTVFSQSTRKQEDAKLERHFDLIINTVSADIDWNQYLKLLKVDGTMVVVGIPEKETSLAAASIVMGRRSLAGSAIGGIQETQEMLDFCGQHKITSDIETVPMHKVNEAYERVLKSDVRYRFVIDMASLKAR